MLNKLGVQAFFANSGKEAIIMAKAQKFDLIFMDIQMPDIDGIETTQILKETLHITCPIIALTANILQSQIKKYLSEGMDDFLSKPLTLDNLRKTMLKWTNNKPLNQG